MFDISSDERFNPMNQRSRDYARQRQMTLGDLLLENRIIFLEGEINDYSANLVVMKMLYLQYENKKQEIHFYINSPAGRSPRRWPFTTRCSFSNAQSPPM